MDVLLMLSSLVSLNLAYVSANSCVTQCVQINNIPSLQTVIWNWSRTTSVAYIFFQPSASAPQTSFSSSTKLEASAWRTGLSPNSSSSTSSRAFQLPVAVSRLALSPTRQTPKLKSPWVVPATLPPSWGMYSPCRTMGLHVTHIMQWRRWDMF